MFILSNFIFLTSLCCPDSITDNYELSKHSEVLFYLFYTPTCFDLLTYIRSFSGSFLSITQCLYKSNLIFYILLCFFDSITEIITICPKTVKFYFICFPEPHVSTYIKSFSGSR
jgi:hypothetical protein